jgi:hypothetical protein
MSNRQLHFTLAGGQVTSDANKCQYGYMNCLSIPNIKAIFDTQYKQKEVNAGTESVDTFNWSDLTYTGDVGLRFYKISMKLTVRNNYFKPCWTTIYKIRLKTDVQTGYDPVTMIQTGLDDVGLNDNGWETVPQFFPTDSPSFNEYYEILEKCSVYLKPGDETHKTIVRTGVYHNFEHIRDLTAQSIINPAHQPMFLVRVIGVVAHDTTDADVNWADGKIDYVNEIKASFKFIENSSSIIFHNIGTQLNTIDTTARVALPHDPVHETALS